MQNELRAKTQRLPFDYSKTSQVKLESTG
jgi:hypothetical protein